MIPRQTSNDLNSRMKAYRQSAGARIAAGCADRFGNWFVYAAAAGSALALSSNASASIVYGTLNKTASITPLNGDPLHATSAPFSIDGAQFGVEVISASGAFGPSHFNAARLYQLSGRAGLGLNNSHQLKRLASGNQVSAGKITFGNPAFKYPRALYATGGYFYGPTSAYGTWPKSQKGFAGIGIKKNGNTYLGWLRLEYFESSKGAIDKIEAFDYAYNTDPAASIAAGDMGVPEPSTAALTLLAAGASGIAALRRRRASKA